jgi:hypothetical protein
MSLSTKFEYPIAHWRFGGSSEYSKLRKAEMHFELQQSIIEIRLGRSASRMGEDVSIRLYS